LWQTITNVLQDQNRPGAAPPPPPPSYCYPYCY